MVFNKNVPQPGDELDDSQADLLNNNLALNSVFGIDHYQFDNITANSGFHNTVTTPIIVGSAHPTTSASLCKLYAMTANNAGLLQFSRGISNAAPTPVTNVQSPIFPGALTINNGQTINILDFAGMTLAVCEFIVVNLDSFVSPPPPYVFGLVFSNGPQLAISSLHSSGGLSIGVSGTTLTVTNNSGVAYTKIYWTLKMHRVN